MDTDTALPTTSAPANSLRRDLTAGGVVFLVALPLCLGVALASNAPLFGGLLAGIVGGLVVGLLSGSQTSVSGPAAGLAAVVATQIAKLGSYESFLLAVMLCGAIQILLGWLKAGTLAAFVPGSVIRGLLAAIGLILIIKQLPHLVGYSSELLGKMSLQPDHAPPRDGFWQHIHVPAGVIGILSLAVLLAWDQTPRLKRSLIPGALCVVVGAVVLQLLLARVMPAEQLTTRQLVQVPVAANLMGVVGFLTLPDFSALTRPGVYLTALTLALVASLETLLNLEAVDRLDPRRRTSPPNRELIAQGAGNLLSGLLGGLPVTSVIVRSSVNINAGAQTRLSAIVHGFLLLTCVVLIPAVLNQIPLSCLAAVLIATGLKLASPGLFLQMYRSGWEQFLPFVVTVGAILATDLLVGIMIGLVFSILFILRSNMRTPLRTALEHHVGGKVLHVKLANQVSFLNRVALLRTLDEVPPGGNLLIDASETDYLDPDARDLLREMRDEIGPARGIEVSLTGFDPQDPTLSNLLRYTDQANLELQSRLTPDEILAILAAGNRRFQTGETLVRDLVRHRGTVAGSRHPLAVVLSGASSRTPVELIFDVSLGDLICTRVAGNLPSQAVLATIEYACVEAGTGLVIVMGHTSNSLIRLAVEHQLGISSPEIQRAEHLRTTLETIHESLDSSQLTGWRTMNAPQQEALVNQVAKHHVQRMLGLVLERSRVIRDLHTQGRIKVVGAMYDVQSGHVAFFDEAAPAQ
ncbi:MAG: bifunctional SulP family inorganic anion transporter/carbonic anhydrase [Planctomycetaceae bacterium]